MERTTKWVLVLSVRVIGILLVGPFVVPVLSPWSEINCEHQEIDIKTGKARFRKYIWFVQVSERTKETMISELLGGREVSVADVRRWHRVNTFGPYVRHSPHYRYHGAFSQIHHLDLTFQLYDTSQAERTRAAEGLLAVWQRAGDYFGAVDFLIELDEEFEDKSGDDIGSSTPPRP